MKNERAFRSDRVMSYFRAEWLPLTFVTVSGLLYNIGLIASPWFEGQLAECLTDILNKKQQPKNGSAGSRLFCRYTGGTDRKIC